MSGENFITLPPRLNVVSGRQARPTVRRYVRQARCMLETCRYARRKYRTVQWVTTGLTWAAIVSGFAGYAAGLDVIGLYGAIVAGVSHAFDTWLLGAVEDRYFKELDREGSDNV